MTDENKTPTSQVIQIETLPVTKYTVALNTVISQLQLALLVPEEQQKLAISTASYMLRVVAEG